MKACLLGTAAIVWLFTLSWFIVVIRREEKRRIKPLARCGSCGSVITDYAYLCQEVTCCDCLAEEGLGPDSGEWEKR